MRLQIRFSVLPRMLIWAFLAIGICVSPLNAQPVKISGELVAGGDVWRQYALSPDGLYAVYVADKEIDGREEIYSVRLSTGSIVNLTGGAASGGYVQSFSISPDSKYVVFDLLPSQRASSFSGESVNFGE